VTASATRQYRKTVPFVLRKSLIAGRGAFATRRIRKGARIIEYKGKRLTAEEADLLPEDDESKPHHTVLFSLDDGSVIDASEEGNEARFINHCCDPNCEAVEKNGRIYIYALRAIEPGEELCYDYSYEVGGRRTEALKRLYPCYCGADNCRGTILAPPPKRRRARARRRKRD
jgi:SET domain-containing protein